MGWFGGGSGSRADDRYDEQVEIQYEMDQKTERFGWEQTLENYEQTIVNNAVQSKNLEEATLWKEEGLKRDYKHTLAMREFDFNSQIGAYNKSERLYGAQLDLNRKAATIAYENATAVAEERYKGLEFQAAAQALKYKQDKETSTQKLGDFRAESAFKGQANLLKSLKSQGSIKARGVEGRSTGKNLQADIAEYAAATAQMADSVIRADSAYNMQMLGLDKSNLLNLQQNYETELSIGKAQDRAFKKVAHDKYSSDLSADAKRLGKPVMAPLPPPPLALPRSQILDPRLPVRGPAPMKGAGSHGAGAAADTAASIQTAISTTLQIASMFAMFCDLRLKDNIRELEVSEVDDTLSALAFAVKDFREYS
mgnify:CR=1 FL=1